MGLVDLGLCATNAADWGVGHLADSPYLTNLRSLDLRRRRFRYPEQGDVALAQSPLLGRLRRLLLGNTQHSNGLTDDILKIARPPHKTKLSRERMIASLMLKSPHLSVGQLVECDLEELWKVGDTRERQPVQWDEWEKTNWNVAPRSVRRRGTDTRSR